MQPTQIVLDNPPNDNQIYEGIPLQNVVSYVFSRNMQCIKSYSTSDGTYLLGLYDFAPMSLLDQCKKKTNLMKVLSPVIFINKHTKKQRIITKPSYYHVPFKLFLTMKPLQKLKPFKMPRELTRNAYSCQNVKHVTFAPITQNNSNQYLTQEQNEQKMNQK
ncbi:Hypothetical_protein [Hexamita inflata]|uniref:Hypothetical_protein n=1 Tax=Hexamita inflata TaxID=28002 RepID=A0AA86RQJ2_9EUKA|nr:Hypothetical protein HINF_LOCUS58435 [Hexamita inflata]